MNYSRKHFMRKRIWIHRCMYSRKIIMQLLLMKPIRNFWQKYWQIQRCGRCSIHWQRRWSNKFYIQMSIFIVHMENLSPSNLLKSPSFSIKMMEIDWQRVTIGWSSPKVALQRPPQKKLNKGLQFDFDRAIIIYQTRPYSSAG